MLPRRSLLGLALLAAGAGLGACSRGEPVQTSFQRLGFSALAPIRLNVGAVEIVDAYTPPRRAPHVDHLAPNPPYETARAMAEDRLRAAGSGGKARFIVQDARIVEVKLQPPGGIRGMFARDPSERYEARIAVRMEVFDAENAPLGHVEAETRRTHTVNEGTSQAERNAVWNDMVSRMMEELNVEFEFQIRRHLNHVLVAGPAAAEDRRPAGGSGPAGAQGVSETRL
ncbi:MAG: hypothetical protein IT557_17685 [Alphaproteobacteria bacterium]|nr:hypothetical protein [Alphaproteobacteria bacterium]